MENCIFCKILAKEIPATVVYEDDLVFAFMDIRPVTKGHLLVIPKRHSQLITQMTDEEGARLFQVAMKINAALRKLPGVQDISLHISDGPAAQQEVPHVHLHIIPRYEGDGFGWKFPPGYGEMAKAEELSTFADELKKKIER